MATRLHFLRMLAGLLMAAFAAAAALAQPPAAGTVRGKVVLAERGTPLHHATVVLLPLGMSAETDDAGEFLIVRVPPGTYGVVAHMHSLTDERKTIIVTEEAGAVADFELRLQPIREAITVTASGQEVSTVDAFQSVVSKESFELTTKAAAPALGEVLDGEPGIAKRSSGPGASRPVIRGFDGDRVLVLQDGIRSGTLSSQSGDHGEPLNVADVEKIEVVRGPASLLYGSNAIGGVVNVISGHHILHQHPHEGLRGSFTTTGGTNNRIGGGSLHVEYGKGNWLLHGAGGSTFTGSYRSPLGRVENSAAAMSSLNMGVGRFGEKFSFNLSYGYQNGRYGVPFEPPQQEGESPGTVHGNDRNARLLLSRVSTIALLNPRDEEQGEEGHGAVQLAWRRHNTRLQTAVKKLGDAFEDFQFSLNYSDWNHKEIDVETNTVGTRFFNRQTIYRGTFTQKKRGRLTGSFGLWGMYRDFEALGEEALAPPVKQTAIAAFGLQEISFERFRLQFGARLENNGFSPVGLSDRSFTGMSASAGIYVPTWKGGTAVVNYMHSFRAPSLEELYNHGPHPGNGIYEIGNPDLTGEQSDGVELSVRHQARRLRLETNLFRYQLHNFIYFNPTGDLAAGLPVAEYRQGDARYLGADARMDVGLRSWLWLNTGVDVVDAQLTETRVNLPRIPPLRGRVGFDWRWKGLSVKPEAVIANKQWQLAPNETLTAGYAVFNINADYTYAQQHLLHTISVNSFNLGDLLYRNHLSFIKEFAPEIGRGIRFGYTVQWF